MRERELIYMQIRKELDENAVSCDNLLSVMVFNWNRQQLKCATHRRPFFGDFGFRELLHKNVLNRVEYAT